MVEFRIVQKNGRVHLVTVDECDEHFLRESRYKWGVRKDTNTYYVKRNTQKINGKQAPSELLHRLVMGCVPGDGMMVDHKDGDGLNNTRANLRVCTNQQNMGNTVMPNTNKSGFKGVCFHKGTGKYHAQIGHNGCKIHIGLYDDPRVAAAAYVAKEQELRGEFA